MQTPPVSRIRKGSSPASPERSRNKSRHWFVTQAMDRSSASFLFSRAHATISITINIIWWFQGDTNNRDTYIAVDLSCSCPYNSIRLLLMILTLPKAILTSDDFPSIIDDISQTWVLLSYRCSEISRSEWYEPGLVPMYVGVTESGTWSPDAELTIVYGFR